MKKMNMMWLVLRLVLVKKSNIVTGENIVEGDVLVGIASSGIHSNGFSLVRKIVFEDQGYEIDSYVAGYEDLGSIGKALLEPTKIYAKPVLEIHEELDVHGMGHITGGGFYENLPRMMPAGLRCRNRLRFMASITSVFNVERKRVIS